jgi:gliding motility-associated-like protein
MAGLNPDPNNDNDPIEKFFTSVTINYKAPSPPVVENKTYVFGTNIPANIGGLVKSTPTGTIPVWCNEKTAACLILPPATPTQIGRYIFTLRSYDTTTLLYSEMFVYDTIIIKPPIPDVVNKKYVINNTNNPLNISSQVTGMAGSVINYYKNSILQSVVPILGSLPGTTRYTSSQIVNTIESDTVGFTITMLEPAALLHIQKLADEPKLQSNSTFNITYTFIVTNKTTEAMTNVLLEDNLQNTFPAPITFDVVSITSSGGLVFNNAFNGKTDIQLLKATSILAASAIDTLRLVVNLQPKGYNGTVNNLAIVTASSSYGPLKINSSSKANNEVSAKLPTPSVIPNLVIDIPEAFSPNRDGVNDRFVILKPFGTTLELEIFNRWGNVVYYNSNYNNDWDGRGTNNFIGQDLVDGGYYYTLKAKSANGNSQIFKGFVLIQR